MKKNGNDKLNNKMSLKRYIFFNVFVPISILIFIIISIFTIYSIINENKKINLFINNQTKLLANIVDNNKRFEIIKLNNFVNKDAYIIFRDPILKYDIFYTRQSPLNLELFDNNFLEFKSGIIEYKKYKLFFEESYLSKVCVIVVPKIFFYKNNIQILFHSLLVYILIDFFLYVLLFTKSLRFLSNDLTRIYIFIKYLLEGKYNINEICSKIYEIDNIRYGLNNLVNIMKERREFYNFLILFQKKVLDLIPVGIIIFNENGIFEDANNFGYAQLEREIKKQNIEIDDLTSIITEKFTIDSIIVEETLNNLNENNIVELKPKPNVTFTKRVFGKIISKKKIILLVPLNISIDDENEDRLILLRQTLAPFISDFAHELRSPLNSIMGFSQIIKDGVEGDNIEEIMNDSKIINESAQIMMAFIDDIIFLSRLGVKSFDSIKVPFKLNILFSLIDHYFKGIYKNKDVSFVYPTDLQDDEIIGDFQSLRRIIILILFYLRSLYPLPTSIELKFSQYKENVISIRLNYIFNNENFQSQKISNIYLDFCNEIAKAANFEILNKMEDKNNGFFEIRFNYKEK